MYDVYGDAAMIVISYMSIAKRRRENFGRKGKFSDGIWRCVATATMWRAGSPFQTRAAETGKARSPTVL